MTDEIKIETADRVTLLTISRAEKRNAITQAMYAAMAGAIRDYGGDDEARALVITGAGEYFTAGNDLNDFAAGDWTHDAPPVAQFLAAISQCPKPLIAAVNGPAIGIGLTMLLHCDLVYLGQSVTLRAPFVKLGVVPEAASSLLLPATVGMAIANDILLAGRELTADEALQFGLAARIFPDTELMAETKKIALQVANSAPNAMRKSKALIRSHLDAVAERMSVEGEIFSEQLQSPEFAESVAAMMQKRPPNYG